LRDNNGTIVNSRNRVTLTGLDIVLGGDDFDCVDNVDNQRILTIEATYDGTYGNDLPLNAEYLIPVENFRGIA
jgi:hypothetical protein